ncbi:uncharacterized protein LOC135434327 [Drosophila montana]|uniref:uncharacterized protein LOC135434327 n=1 Tax=Drosophila montana TaxID=40370 RepID=UPI00313AC5F2
MVQRSTKFTGICIAIYLVYALFVFFILPMLLPDPVTLSRNLLAQQTRHLGNLTNITLEAGGQPKRSILVTFRGSGAIGLLEYLSRQPGCYHHFSPLIAYKHRITDLAKIDHALDELTSLFNCDYNKSLTMLNYGMQTPTFRNFYGVQWKTCVTYTTEVCSKPETLSQICKLFPFLNMSVYNLGLKFLMALLERKDLNVRILLLVRDPRATMASRLNRLWCSNPECFRPNDLCSNMAVDYDIAEILLRKHPQRFGIVRYEELALNPTIGLKAIFDFYGLPTESENDVQKSKENGTEANESNNMYFEKPTQWQNILSIEEIMNIQETCKRAMKLWGYYPITDNEKEQKLSYKPLKNLPLFLK